MPATSPPEPISLGQILRNLWGGSAPTTDQVRQSLRNATDGAKKFADQKLFERRRQAAAEAASKRGKALISDEVLAKAKAILGDAYNVTDTRPAAFEALHNKLYAEAEAATVAMESAVLSPEAKDKLAEQLFNRRNLIQDALGAVETRYNAESDLLAEGVGPYVKAVNQATQTDIALARTGAKECIEEFLERGAQGLDALVAQKATELPKIIPEKAPPADAALKEAKLLRQKQLAQTGEKAGGKARPAGIVSALRGTWQRARNRVTEVIGDARRNNASRQAREESFGAPAARKLVSDETLAQAQGLLEGSGYEVPEGASFKKIERMIDRLDDDIERAGEQMRRSGLSEAAQRALDETYARRAELMENALELIALRKHPSRFVYPVEQPHLTKIMASLTPADKELVRKSTEQHLSDYLKLQEAGRNFPTKEPTVAAPEISVEKVEEAAAVSVKKVRPPTAKRYKKDAKRLGEAIKRQRDHEVRRGYTSPAPPLHGVKVDAEPPIIPATPRPILKTEALAQEIVLHGTAVPAVISPAPTAPVSPVAVGEAWNETLAEAQTAGTIASDPVDWAKIPEGSPEAPRIHPEAPLDLELSGRSITAKNIDLSFTHNEHAPAPSYLSEWGSHSTSYSSAIASTESKMAPVAERVAQVAEQVAERTHGRGWVGVGAGMAASVAGIVGFGNVIGGGAAAAAAGSTAVAATAATTTAEIAATDAAVATVAPDTAMVVGELSSGVAEGMALSA